MADFEKALLYTLPFEGGESDSPDDPGGHTNLGITQRSLDAFNEKLPDAHLPDNVHDLTHAHAEVFYSTGGYWSYDGIHSNVVASKLFDMGVNMGVRTAVKMAQTELIHLGYGCLPDGVYGPVTECIINAVPPATLVNSLCNAAASHYNDLAAHNSNLNKYLHGWLRRALAVPHDEVIS